MNRLTLSLTLAVAWLAAAQTPSPRPEFEAASVKINTTGDGMMMIAPLPGGRFKATNATLKMLVGVAWKVQTHAISGGPSWIDSDHYDVEAKAADGNLTIDQLRPLLQAMLEDRFQLKTHMETKDVPVYALLPMKGGPKLPDAKEGGCQEVKPGALLPGGGGLVNPGQPACGLMMMGRAQMQAAKIGMRQLAGALSNILGRPVIDETGFTGSFDLHLEYSPEGLASGRGGMPMPAPNAPAPDISAPSIFTAVQEQLGLKLESQKGPGEILVIDHAGKASEN